MKKLLATGCCIIALQSFSQVAPITRSSVAAEGKRVLIRAIAVMVNTEANRKMPQKTNPPSQKGKSAFLIRNLLSGVSAPLLIEPNVPVQTDGFESVSF